MQGNQFRRNPRSDDSHLELIKETNITSNDNEAGGGTLKARSEALRLIDSAELLACARETVLVHNGENFRLRITSNGKLILTK